MKHPFQRNVNLPKKRHPLYGRWSKLISLTTNKYNEDYHTYGGKGIKMCDEWRLNFSNFLLWAIKNGYKEELVICRKNKNKDFNPDNCFFAEHAYSKES
jgi:hypothetical protein